MFFGSRVTQLGGSIPSPRISQTPSDFVFVLYSCISYFTNKNRINVQTHRVWSRAITRCDLLNSCEHVLNCCLLRVELYDPLEAQLHLVWLSCGALFCTTGPDKLTQNYYWIFLGRSLCIKVVLSSGSVFEIIQQLNKGGPGTNYKF